MTYKLSILDLCTILPGETPGDTVRRTAEAAREYEALGYKRIWYAEHHNTNSVLSTSPAVMISYIANHVHAIRLGSGGVMLPNHSPLHVAEDFALLEAMAPGRIDLGLGRAPGTDPMTAFALRRSMEAMEKDDFPQQMEELLHYFDRDFPPKHPFRNITATASPDRVDSGGTGSPAGRRRPVFYRDERTGQRPACEFCGKMPRG